LYGVDPTVGEATGAGIYKCILGIKETVIQVRPPSVVRFITMVIRLDEFVPGASNPTISPSRRLLNAIEDAPPDVNGGDELRRLPSGEN